MGASLIRRDWGETLDDMAERFGYQFAGILQKWVGKWHDLAVDQHLLIALSAPRPVFVSGGSKISGAIQRVSSSPWWPQEVHHDRCRDGGYSNTLRQRQSRGPQTGQKSLPMIPTGVCRPRQRPRFL